MPVELLATRVTSLEMAIEDYRGRKRVSGAVPAMRVEEVPRLPLQRYRDLYASVGAAHHWTSRVLPDKALAEEIYNPRTRIFTAEIGQDVVGWFEIEVKRNIRQARIVHFGILPGHRGKGLAGPLLEEAIAAGFAEAPNRLTIETNTLDHPAALALYRKHGFVPYAARDVKTPTWASLAGTRTAAE